MKRLPVLLLASSWLVPMQVAAQAPTSSKAGEQAATKAARETPIPRAYLPPPGMCRIWVDNVPAARQPAPTDCATAIRNRPPNARVVFPAGKDGKGQAPDRPDTTKRKPPG